MRQLRFAAGFLLAVVCLLAVAEAFLRRFPPRDLYPYLGEQSPLRGPYRPDADFATGYRTWEAFADENAERLAPYLPLGSGTDQRPMWALFGNSFFQAPGMLADHARRRLPDRVIFNLGKNEPLQVRFAQIKLLLEHGLKPERVFVELMPVDCAPLGEHPLWTTHVTSRGAITYTARPTIRPLAWLGSHSRLGLTALVRLGRYEGNPAFNRQKLYEGIHPTLLADLCHLFANLARVTGEWGVPVTVVLIPAYHQIAQGKSFNFQDTLSPMLRELGLDVCDPRDRFLACPDKKRLFIPDRHFSDVGNEILLDELLAHLNGEKLGGHVAAERRAR
jgi:hypothetical protein